MQKSVYLRSLTKINKKLMLQIYCHAYFDLFENTLLSGLVCMR